MAIFWGLQHVLLENPPFINRFPMTTSRYRGFPFTMLDYWKLRLQANHLTLIFPKNPSRNYCMSQYVQDIHQLVIILHHPILLEHLEKANSPFRAGKLATNVPQKPSFPVHFRHFFPIFIHFHPYLSEFIHVFAHFTMSIFSILPYSSIFYGIFI